MSSSPRLPTALTLARWLSFGQPAPSAVAVDAHGRVYILHKSHLVAFQGSKELWRSPSLAGAQGAQGISTSGSSQGSSGLLCLFSLSEIRVALASTVYCLEIETGKLKRTVDLEVSIQQLSFLFGDFYIHGRVIGRVGNIHDRETSVTLDEDVVGAALTSFFDAGAASSGTARSGDGVVVLGMRSGSVRVYLEKSVFQIFSLDLGSPIAGLIASDGVVTVVTKDGRVQQILVHADRIVLGDKIHQDASILAIHPYTETQVVLRLESELRILSFGDAFSGEPYINGKLKIPDELIQQIAVNVNDGRIYAVTLSGRVFRSKVSKGASDPADDPRLAELAELRLAAVQDSSTRLNIDVKLKPGQGFMGTEVSLHSPEPLALVHVELTGDAVWGGVTGGDWKVSSRVSPTAAVAVALLGNASVCKFAVTPDTSPEASLRRSLSCLSMFAVAASGQTAVVLDSLVLPALGRFQASLPQPTAAGAAAAASATAVAALVTARLSGKFAASEARHWLSLIFGDEALAGVKGGKFGYCHRAVTGEKTSGSAAVLFLEGSVSKGLVEVAGNSDSAIDTLTAMFVQLAKTKGVPVRVEVEPSVPATAATQRDVLNFPEPGISSPGEAAAPEAAAGKAAAGRLEAELRAFDAAAFEQLFGGEFRSSSAVF